MAVREARAIPPKVQVMSQRTDVHMPLNLYDGNLHRFHEHRKIDSVADQKRIVAPTTPCQPIPPTFHLTARPRRAYSGIMDPLGKVFRCGTPG